MSFDLSLFNRSQLVDGVLPPHQKAGVQFLLDHPKVLLADDVGLGKTVQAAAALAVLKALGVLGFCLVVAPAHLVQQWVSELRRWVPSLTVQDQTQASRRSGMLGSESGEQEPLDVLIGSYEFLHSRHLDPSRLPVRVVVLDEAAQLRSGGAEHAAIMRLTQQAERVVALTATPFENNALETYQILKLLQLPDLWQQVEFENRFIRWSGEYLDGYGRVVPRKPVGLIEEELPKLREFLARYYLRRTAEGLSLPLPVRVGETVRWVPPLPAQQMAMRRADQMPAGLGRHRARERACGVVGDRSSNAEAAVDEILRRPNEPKFVAWAFHKQHLDVMEQLLELHGIGHVRIDGAIRGGARETRLDRFRDDPLVRVLLGTDVFGSGLNLQHARVMLSLGSSYNPGKEMQREGRIRRLGSPHATYEHITFLNDFDHERNKAKVLRAKTRDSRALLA